MPFPQAFQSYVPESHCIESQTYGIILISPYDEILVVKGRLSNKWGFPKGHGEANEKPLIAALRELKEEAGIDLSDYTPTFKRRFKRKSGKFGGIYFIYHLDFKPLPCIQDNKEISDVAWCPRERLPFLFGNMDLNTFCYKKCHIDPAFTNMKLK
jgi:8-oxo-dGTP pyrophosphatase MutT (NUDIX family)